MARTSKAGKQRGTGSMQLHGRRDLHPIGVPSFNPKKFKTWAAQLEAKKRREAELAAIEDEQRREAKQLNSRGQAGKKHRG